jgi:hypothetical protein
MNSAQHWRNNEPARNNDLADVAAIRWPGQHDLVQRPQLYRDTGNSIPVPSWDVGILEANGWTLFATNPGPILPATVLVTLREAVCFNPSW